MGLPFCKVSEAENLAQWWTALPNSGSTNKYEAETDGLSETNVHQVQDDLASFEGTWGGI